MQALAVRTFLLGLAALVLAGPAHGARVENLYTAEVSRPDLALIGMGKTEIERAGGRSLRRDLMRAALARVVVRVAGTSQVAADPMVRRELIERAPSLVNRFQFLSRGGRDGPRIRVHFSPEPVRDGLWDTGWPVWGAFRPGILVWAAQRRGGGLQLVGPDSGAPVFKALRQGADREGLPLVLPLMDGSDRSRLTARNLLFEDWEAIDAASRRYDADTVVLLRLGRKAGETRAEWVLRGQDGTRSFVTRGADTAEAVSAGMRQVMVRLACSYAVFPGGSVTMQAVVDGIPGLSGFARIERGLGRLAALEGVTPLRVAGDEARFRFAFQGRANEAAHILSLLDLLQPRGRIVAESGTDNGDEPRLKFTYRP